MSLSCWALRRKIPHAAFNVHIKSTAGTQTPSMHEATKTIKNKHTPMAPVGRLRIVLSDRAWQSYWCCRKLLIQCCCAVVFLVDHSDTCLWQWYLSSNFSKLVLETLHFLGGLTIRSKTPSLLPPVFSQWPPPNSKVHKFLNCEFFSNWCLWIFPYLECCYKPHTTPVE